MFLIARIRIRGSKTLGEEASIMSDKADCEGCKEESFESRILLYENEKMIKQGSFRFISSTCVTQFTSYSNA
jgi:hypothetical protein